MNDTFKLLQSCNLTGLNDGFYHNINVGNSGFEFPKRVGYVTTALTTTGSGTKIRTGFGIMDYGNAYLTPIAVSDQDLNSSAYKYFLDYSTGTTYTAFVTNNTGGVVKGSVKWYAMLS